MSFTSHPGVDALVRKCLAGMKVSLQEVIDLIDGKIPEPDLSGLSTIEIETFQAATTSPITSKMLARLAGYEWRSHFKAAVTTLVRRGLLKRTADGLSRA